MNIVDYLTAGSRLNSISRICDLIKIDFISEGKVICLHSQSALMRGLKNNELLISSNDIFLPSKQYKKKLFRKFKWDIPGNTLFDDQLMVFEKEVINKNLLSVHVLGKDLILELDDNYKIEILSCTLEKGRELFRMFIKGELDSHIVFDS